LICHNLFWTILLLLNLDGSKIGDLPSKFQWSFALLLKKMLAPPISEKLNKKSRSLDEIEAGLG
jgi:hypothetical protein